MKKFVNKLNKKESKKKAKLKIFSFFLDENLLKPKKNVHLKNYESKVGNEL